MSRGMGKIVTGRDHDFNQNNSNTNFRKISSMSS